MRALLQRVTRASVSIDGVPWSSIGGGLVVLVGIGQGDSLDDARFLVDKIANLRIFADDEGRFNHSLLDVHGELLVVSQFTLYATTRRGRRPGFTEAASPAQAEPLFSQTVDLFRQTGLRVEVGRFAQHMVVELYNDGPVTIWLDSSERFHPRD